MDLYLMDLLLKGAISTGKILDVGFGTGRNLIHFLQRNPFAVYGIDTDQSCVSLMQMMITGFRDQDPTRFQLSSVTEMTYPEKYFQTVLCAQVFHFLNDAEKVNAWERIYKVLVPGGLLYLSANSMVNFENRSEPRPDQKHTFPDGTSGYFLSEKRLTQMVTDPRFEKVEPVRNIQYDDQHAETIMVLRKK